MAVKRKSPRDVPGDKLGDDPGLKTLKKQRVKDTGNGDDNGTGNGNRNGNNTGTQQNQFLGAHPSSTTNLIPQPTPSLTHREPLDVATSMAVKRKIPKDGPKDDNLSNNPGDNAGLPAIKKLRVSPQNQPTSAPAFIPHEEVIRQLDSKCAVKTMSVQPSTKISHHVDKALEHLGRFSPWDMTVLPGVVLLYAKAKAMNKLITICETVRRRINEAEQKWFVYNTVTEMELEAQVPRFKHLSVDLSSVVDDTIAAHLDDDGDEEDEEDDFETMGTAPTVFEQAVVPTRTEYRAYLSVFISRVPMPELKALAGAGYQTNERHINQLRLKRTGIV